MEDYQIRFIRTFGAETGNVRLCIRKIGDILIDKQIFGNFGEMETINYVIADTKGIYIVALNEEKSNKRKYLLKSEKLPDKSDKLGKIIQEFNLLANPSGRKDVYMQMGNLFNVTGTECNIIHLETEVIRSVTPIHTNYCFMSVLRFNRLGLDADCHLILTMM